MVSAAPTRTPVWLSVSSWKLPGRLTFIRNMFIKPTAEEEKNFKPDFIVYNASKAKVENYKELGLNSETCVCSTSLPRAGHS
jgi:ATP-dependent phosphoenolpyruvate carboxykinase